MGAPEQKHCTYFQRRQTSYTRWASPAIWSWLLQTCSTWLRPITKWLLGNDLIASKVQSRKSKNAAHAPEIHLLRRVATSLANTHTTYSTQTTWRNATIRYQSRQMPQKHTNASFQALSQRQTSPIDIGCLFESVMFLRVMFPWCFHVMFLCNAAMWCFFLWRHNVWRSDLNCIFNILLVHSSFVLPLPLWYPSRRLFSGRSPLGPLAYTHVYHTES